MDTQHFDEWTAAATSGTYTPLPSERLIEMFQWTTIHGSSNCWSGTSGTAATMIRELLLERIGLKEQIERLSDERDRLRGVRAEQGTSGAG